MKYNFEITINLYIQSLAKKKRSNRLSIFTYAYTYKSLKLTRCELHVERIDKSVIHLKLIINYHQAFSQKF